MASRRIPKRLQQSLLKSILQVMVDAGLGEAEIRASFETVLSKTLLRKEARGKLQRERYRDEGDLSADLLRRWHRDDRYLDSVYAKPKPLHLTKGRQSIKAMALDMNPQANVNELIHFLMSSGLIRKCADGKYVPTTEVGAISHSDKFVAEHVAKSIVRFVSTVRRNAKLGLVGQSLIERFAYVSDLDPENLSRFGEFTKSQGHAYLQVVDDWMEQRRVKAKRGRSPKSKKGVFAGLHIIAYMDSGLGSSHATSANGARGSEGSDEGGLSPANQHT